jgi:hypothetical protein
VRFDAVTGGLKGFFAYYGCHLVTAGSSDFISPDFAGLAMRELMDENPGAVGCFIQGAEGDINTGCASVERAEECLSVLSRRFASAVRNGLDSAKPLDCTRLQCRSLDCDFSYLSEYTPDYVQHLFNGYAAKVFTEDTSDSDQNLCWNLAFLKGAERLLGFVKSHTAINARITAIRLGDLELLGAPFEIMSAIKIQDNGYGLWLDDFGSGYSSINMFSQFHFDLIKYDMELLRHLDDNNGVNRIILKELVCIAKQLKLHTLVEGLEDDDQLRFIQNIECELAQGYYYCRPGPLDDILFRKNGGQEMKPCETREERDAFRN